MSGPGTVERGAPLRIVHGELALLGACTCAARLDFEHAETRDWIERAAEIAAGLPAFPVLVEPLPLYRLAEALAAFREALERVARLPTGEADWQGPAHAQGELREAVTNAMASLYGRAAPVWRHGEAPPWETVPAAWPEPAEA